MRLTVQSARDLAPGQTLRDHVVKGLQLRARGSLDRPGVKSWHYYYFFEGQERKPKIGEFPTVGIEDAREAAKALARQIAQGHDPSAERAERREAPTVADLAALYDRVKVSKLKTRTQEEYRRNLRLHVVPRLGRMKVAEVTTADVDNALDHLKGPARNRVRENLSGMFRLAMHSDYSWRTDRNPVTDSQRAPERPRKRKMEAAEFAAVAKALDDLQEQYPRQVAAIRVMLLAGSRVTELVTAKRSELEAFKIRLKEHKTERTGDDREVFLPEQAQEIVDALPVDGPYIFGRGPDGAPHLTRYNLNTVWDKAREAASCPDLQMRDLRRTFASVAGAAGVGLDAVGQLFGHKDPKTTRRYQWLYDSAARGNAQATADRLSELMGGPKPAASEDHWSG